MKCFMITVALPGTFTPEFSSLIPPQRAYINKLMGRGIVSTYTLSASELMAFLSVVSKRIVSFLVSTYPPLLKRTMR